MAELLEAVSGLKTSSKIDRFRALKGSKTLSYDKFTNEIKNLIKEIPKPDNTDVTQSLQSVISRLDEVVNEIQDSINSIDIPVTDLTNLDSGIKSIGPAIEKSIKGIKPVDLSGVERSIKGIKPTDISELERQIKILSTILSQPKETREIDLTPVIEALTQPRTVEFNIDYDSWDYPVKITAKET